MQATEFDGPWSCLSIVDASIPAEEQVGCEISGVGATHGEHVTHWIERNTISLGGGIGDRCRRIPEVIPDESAFVGDSGFHLNGAAGPIQFHGSTGDARVSSWFCQEYLWFVAGTGTALRSRNGDGADWNLQSWKIVGSVQTGPCCFRRNRLTAEEGGEEVIDLRRVRCGRAICPVATGIR
jgi:hypothetical protein